jgi:hypothetical protein
MGLDRHESLWLVIGVDSETEKPGCPPHSQKKEYISMQLKISASGLNLENDVQNECQEGF